MAIEFKPLRAAAHRTSVAPEFGATDMSDEQSGFTMAQMMAHPKLSELAVSVYDTLRKQFSEGGESAKQKQNAEEIKYKQRMEQMAIILEILLEETLNELDRFKAVDPGVAGGLG